MEGGDELSVASGWASSVVSRKVGRMSVQIRMAARIMAVEGKSIYEGRCWEIDSVFILTRWDYFDILSGLYGRVASCTTLAKDRSSDFDTPQKDGLIGLTDDEP
jgi:hypothetical protein